MRKKVFIAYAHTDRELCERLKTHLVPLQQKGLISLWNNRDIRPGKVWAEEIETNLNEAKVILLLISSDFIASDYCSNIEMKRALERHEKDEARVIPIILRTCLWETSPIGKLQVLPQGGKPVDTWKNSDKAFFSIVKEIKKAVEDLIHNDPSETEQKDLQKKAKIPAERSMRTNEPVAQLAPQEQITQPPTPKKLSFSWKAAFWGFFLISLILVSIVFSVQEGFFHPNQPLGQATTTPKNHLTPTATPLTPTAFPSSTPQDTHPYPSYLPGHGQSAAYYDSISSGAMWEQDANSDRTGFCGFSNGAYHATINKPGNNYRTCDWLLNGHRNFAYAMQITILQGDCAGVFFRESESVGISYEAVICQGEEGLKLYKIGPLPDTQLRLLKEVPMAINLNERYQVVVVAQDSTLTVFLNGNQVAQTRDSSNLEGYGGVIAIDENHSTDAIFSNATLWTL